MRFRWTSLSQRRKCKIAATHAAGSPEIPESGTDVARRATRATATTATSVSVERVLGSEGQLREIAARQVALDNDEATGSNAAKYAASAQH